MYEKEFAMLQISLKEYMKGLHKHRKVPGHMGGTYDKDNVVYLTPEEHAKEHLTLYETYGKEEDLLAYQGLSGLVPTTECQRQAMSLGGKKGSKVANERMGLGKGSRKAPGKYGDKPGGAKYKGRPDDGKDYIINGEHIRNLSKWCRNKEFIFNTFHKVVIERGKTHKGYSGHRV